MQVIGVSHRDGYYGVEYTHYLLETLHVPSVPLPHLGGVGEPSVFLATRSLVVLDEQAVLSDSSRSIPGECVTMCGEGVRLCVSLQCPPAECY